MEKTERTKFITQDILKSSVIGSFQKLDPNIYGVISGNVRRRDWIFYYVDPDGFPLHCSEEVQNYRIYNGIVTAVLFVTVLFANFAESVAEGRGKAGGVSEKDEERYKGEDTSGRRRREDDQCFGTEKGRCRPCKDG